MADYDLCFAWNWEYDAAFAHRLEEYCLSRNISLLQVTPLNLEQILAEMGTLQTRFLAYFDRASDSDARFTPLADWARDHQALRINPLERACRAWDKATMHLELLTAGLNLPHSIILPPFQEQPEIQPVDLSLLGDACSCKPACGSGGDGVVIQVHSWDQVLHTRQEHPSDNYLLQSYIVPQILAGRPAWFRAIYCIGRVFPCWWHPDTHAYLPLTFTEQISHRLFMLDRILASIAQVCQLDIFSTEVTLAQDGKFTVIDYVNDPIDLRPQSSAVDGVPDAIVHNIIHCLCDAVGKKK